MLENGPTLLTGVPEALSETPQVMHLVQLDAGEMLCLALWSSIPVHQAAGRQPGAGEWPHAADRRS